MSGHLWQTKQYFINFVSSTANPCRYFLYLMKPKFKILIVDDHPMIVEAYKNLLASAELKEYNFSVETAFDIDSALSKIERSAEASKPYDICFFDIKLPPSSDGKIISGEGLALVARELLPEAKIVILTMFNENHRIYNLLKTVNPDGLLIKNDITSRDFIIAMDSIINNPPYYSSTVINYFRKQSVADPDQLLDDINRKIVYFLSQGVKTKNLPNHINLSLSAIEKRKITIKNLLKLQDANDEDMIEEARKRGFI